MTKMASPRLQAQRERLKLRADIVTMQQQLEDVRMKLKIKRQALRNMRGK